MAPNILITGGSGYLGGSLLEHLKSSDNTVSAHGNVYALVRTNEQEKQVKALYNATPIIINLSDQAEITKKLLDNEISIVFYLIDAFKPDTQLLLINALEAVSKKLNVTTHFLHTSGAKLFSGFVGHPTDRRFSDADENLFELQKHRQSKFEPMAKATDANSTIIEAAEAKGVRSYIFIPCIVYGKGTGFGNKISIQTTDIVRAAKAIRRVRKVDDLNGVWPVSSLHDTVTLYAHLLSRMATGKDIGYNKNGYYMAAAGSLPWVDIYAAMAKALAKRGVVDSPEVGDVSDDALEKVAQAMKCPKVFVPVSMGGVCRLQADHGKAIGWTPRDSAEHILAAADDEVDLILQSLRSSSI
ncbi:hypothetical protein LTR95_000778 [Oleoguttula sp. CCFEE 5521]